VVTRAQLLALGVTRRGIEHRVARGRLFVVARGVYLVGRPDLTQHARWMAAVLSCGQDACLTHSSAAALWGFGKEWGRGIEVAVRTGSARRRPGLRIHRRPSLPSNAVRTHEDIRTTSPTQTMIDLTVRSDRTTVERMISDAVRLKHFTPPSLRASLAGHAGEPGVGLLRTILDRREFRLTRSRLEQLFLPMAAQVGLPVPLTKQWVNGFEVDFHWPDLRFVVETDGLAFHRTPAEQAQDRVRDQTHTAAGFVNLRFTHEQIYYEPGYVRRILADTARRLGVSR
jgi:very-short-patch-repair endonuclease